jgi:hypothetical protein
MLFHDILRLTLLAWLYTTAILAQVATIAGQLSNLIGCYQLIRKVLRKHRRNRSGNRNQESWSQNYLTRRRGGQSNQKGLYLLPIA